MDRPHQIFDGGFEFDGGDCLGDQFRRLRTDGTAATTHTLRIAPFVLRNRGNLRLRLRSSLGFDAFQILGELHGQASTLFHLALHGYVDLDYPDRSALVFAPEASGADDGLLQVREIRGMRLNSKLVTLSACNTGVGPVGEVGVSNLVNAFIEAGAESVVSTLWEVEDQSTRHLMVKFYSQLALHSRKIDALRSAQLDLLAKGFPPYFWAGVQLVGDPNGTL